MMTQSSNTLAANTVAGKRNITNDINFLTKKGHIKEATADDVTHTGNGTVGTTASLADHVETAGVDTL